MSNQARQPFLTNDKLLNRLKYCTNLPSPPGVATRIIELAENPSTDMSSVADVVSLDPALTAKILRMANSPLYARRRKTENLRQAIIMFGLNGTLTLALTFSLVSSLRANSISGMNYEAFWRRSLATAICSRLLGISLQLGAKEDLFLAGLLQDIGMLALDKAIPDLYQDIGSKQTDHLYIQAMELKALGSDHAAIGAWLLQSWNLSERFLYAIAGSHNPTALHLENSEHDSFVRCVAVSSIMADILCSSDHEYSSRQAAIHANKLLGLSPEALGSVLDAVADEMKETAVLFEIDLGDAVLMESILEQAKENLMLRNLKGMQETAELHNTAMSLEAKTLELQEKARRDDLTGLYNRAYLNGVIRAEFETAKAYGWPLAIMFLDLDYFKKVNDTFGHAAGDQVLKETARLLIMNTRDSDTVARYGGEEFVVVLPGTDLKGAQITCERLLNAFRAARHEVCSGTEIVVTVSIGIAVQGEGVNFDQAESIVQAADKAVYAAKYQGRNRYVLHKDGSSTQTILKTRKRSSV